MAEDSESNSKKVKTQNLSIQQNDLSTNIPKIILVHKPEETPESSAKASTSDASFLPHGGAGSPAVPVVYSTSEVDNTQYQKSFSNYPPIRSSSDIGLPASSMPNLAFQMDMVNIGLEGGGENHLGVFCSPRTLRRSVDLDIDSRNDKREHFEWIENIDSPSNSLRVLTATGRVGSALSLNSECARSIGLLSNDSDDDIDTSTSDKNRLTDKPTAQLRRYMSHPEAGASPEFDGRPSQSLCNLKSAKDKTAADADSDTTSSIGVTSASLDGANNARKPVRNSDSRDQDASAVAGSEPPGVSAKSKEVFSPLVLDANKRLHTRRPKHRRGSDTTDDLLLSLASEEGKSDRARIMCYRSENTDMSRDGRIRQWLQDMDKHNSYG